MELQDVIIYHLRYTFTLALLASLIISLGKKILASLGEMDSGPGSPPQKITFFWYRLKTAARLTQLQEI